MFKGPDKSQKSWNLCKKAVLLYAKFTQHNEF